MNRARRSAALLAAGLCACGLYACEPMVEVGSDCIAERCIDNGAAGSAGFNPRLPGGRQPGSNIDQLDLLLVIDNSMTMMEEQAALGRELPVLIERLSTGNYDAEAAPDFHPVPDMHVGVISTDLGLQGVSNIQRCPGLGDDGLLRRCGDSGPFASATRPEDASALAMDVVCRSQLGTAGCSFEQPLEAALRALAPAPDGHGDEANNGFLRRDSLLVVLLLTDEEDCSMQDTSIITPAAFLDPGDPLLSQGLNVRCSANPQALFPIARYIDGLSRLRPNASDRTMFFAIAGVPPALVDGAALAEVALEDDDERERFYASLLEAPAMAEVIDDLGTAAPDDDVIRPACESKQGAALPARRLVEVVRGFGIDGLIQSICEPDLSRPLERILGVIARRLGQD